jgi:hypothetical protein
VAPLKKSHQDAGADGKSPITVQIIYPPHAPAAHDDLANAVAGLAAIINKYGSYDHTYRGWTNCTDDDPDGARAWRRAQLIAHLRSCV